MSSRGEGQWLSWGWSLEDPGVGMVSVGRRSPYPQRSQQKTSLVFGDGT